VLSNLVLSCTQEFKELPALHVQNIPYRIDKISPSQLIMKEKTGVLGCYTGLLNPDVSKQLTAFIRKDNVDSESNNSATKYDVVN
jgi:hypothetical protein